MFQSLSREKPFCHSPHGPPIWSLRDEFQSLSREKPFCHDVSQINAQVDSIAFQSLSREKPFCHSTGAISLAKNMLRFQSLSREKPFCHASFHFDRSHAGAVSIAQSRKALLPRYYTPSFVLESHAFQSLSREKPFCHCLFRFVNESKLYSFNRSVAKSPSATSTGGPKVAKNGLVSIAQSRKALLPQEFSKSPRLETQCFNRSVAKSPSATLPTAPGGGDQGGFNRSVAKSPSATLAFAACPSGPC